MSLHRVVCVSHAQPVSSAHDLLAVCRNFPSPRAQAGVRGRMLILGTQFVLLLEGPDRAVRLLLNRIQREVPEPAMEVRFRETVDEPAFATWSITDLYLDEIALCDPASAATLIDRVVDLLYGAPLGFVEVGEAVRGASDFEEGGPEADEAEAEPVDAFAEVAVLLDRFAWVAGRGPKPVKAEAA